MRFGKIPTSMTLVCAAPRPFLRVWEDVDVSIAEGKTVVPCYPADSDSKDTIASARKWARDMTVGSRYPSGRLNADLDKITEVIEDNLPRKLFVVGLEKRAEGGRSFKVLDDKDRLFDLREDVLLEALLTVGVGEGGLLGGEYVFAKLGSQTRLVRVGSSLYAEMQKTDARRLTKNLDEDTLVFGGVYANRRELFVYLGRVDTVEDVAVGPRMVKPLTSAGTAAHRKMTEGSKRVFIQGEHVSVKLSRGDQKYAAQTLQDVLRNIHCRDCLSFGKSIAAVELVSKLDIEPGLIDTLRVACQQIKDKNRLNASPGMVASHGIEAMNQESWEEVRSFSALLNMRPHGQGAAVDAEYEALLGRCKPAS